MAVMVLQEIWTIPLNQTLVQKDLQTPRLAAGRYLEDTLSQLQLALWAIFASTYYPQRYRKDRNMVIYPRHD